MSEGEAEGVPPEYLEEPSRYFLEWIPRLLREHDGAHAHFGKVEAVAQFHLTGDRGGWWYFELGKDGVHVSDGQHPKPSFTLTMDVEIWREINRGNLNGLRAYLRRDLKLKGSRWKLLRVARLFG